MLQSVFVVTADFVRPIADSIAPIGAREGDLIACSTHNERSLLTVHRAADGKVTREVELYWTVASGWLLGVYLDEFTEQLTVNFQQISLVPIETASPVEPSRHLRLLRA